MPAGANLHVLAGPYRGIPKVTDLARNAVRLVEYARRLAAVVVVDVPYTQVRRLHRENHASQRVGWLRAAVLGANDGLLSTASLFELMIVGFSDAGRVFAPGERFRLTTTGLHVSGGGELAARILRNSLVVGGVGAGDEGVRFLFGTRWSY